MPRNRRESLAFTVVVTVLVVLGALLMLAILALSGAPAIVLLATGLAALPVGPLIATYLWLDRYEPEPKRLLAYGLLWGAFVATIAAIVIGGVGGYVAGFSENVSLAVVAPVTEEASKGFFLLLLLWWRRAELDGILDGIVYAGMVGIGFAFTENILYLTAAYDGTDMTGPGGLAGVTGTFLVRCVFSPFAHPLFTAFFGIGVGHRGDVAQPRDRDARHRGWLPARGDRPRPLERLDDLRLRQLRPRLRRPDGAGAGRPLRPRDLGAALRGADAHRGPHRRRAARPGAGHRHRLGGRPPGPPGRPPVRRAVRRPCRRPRDARLPAGRRRARVPAQPAAARYRAQGLAGPRPGVRGPDRRRTTAHRLPRAGRAACDDDLRRQHAGC